MKVEEKPDMKVHGNGKPYFSWKKRGSNMPTHMFKMLVGHVGQHFIAHQKDIDYVPSSIENAYLAKTFCRWLGDVACASACEKIINVRLCVRHTVGQVRQKCKETSDLILLS